jgi:hypothetical protein
MPATPEHHTRAYIQSRLLEEIARARRYKISFTVVTFEAAPGDGLPLYQKMKSGLGAIEGTVRSEDVVALAFDDTIVALLIQADKMRANDALQRIRNQVAKHAGSWRITAYVYPDQADAIFELPVTAA